MNSTMPNYRLFLCILLLQIPAYALAGENDLTPQQLVTRMARATHELNYDGIFIYRHGRQLDTMRIIHKNGSDGEVERLVSLTGHPREVIRNNSSVTCIFPDNKAIIVEKSRPYDYPLAELLEPVENIARYYRISVTGRDRVAGNAATIVTIQPNDNYRYGYELWIDKKDYLLLKSELKNESGYPLEQIIFTKLDVLDSVPDALLKPSVSTAGFTRHDNTKLNPVSKEPVNHWQVKWMPNGFTLSNNELHAFTADGHEVDHMVYTDGVAMVSVFIEKVRQRAQFVPGASKMGAVNAFTSHMNNYQVTAVGEVPPSTVEKMAVSVVNGN